MATGEGVPEALAEGRAEGVLEALADGRSEGVPEAHAERVAALAVALGEGVRLPLAQPVAVAELGAERVRLALMEQLHVPVEVEMDFSPQ